MRSEDERCGEAAKFRAIDAAFRAGDLDALRAAVDERNAAAVQLLLEAGADPTLRTHSNTYSGTTPSASVTT